MQVVNYTLLENKRIADFETLLSYLCPFSSQKKDEWIFVPCRVLVGHRAAVNVVDFDDKYIVSASGDRTIKVCYYVSCWFIDILDCLLTSDGQKCYLFGVYL